jgi:hypothetical protein
VFVVNKASLPKYWVAYSNRVEERIGECLHNTGTEFKTYKEAYNHAKLSKTAILERDYSYLKNAITKFELTIYGIRALWNKNIKALLENYYKDLAEAKAAFYNPPEPHVVLLPQMIHVEGTRLHIGTKVYTVNTYNFSLSEGEVTEEIISYYSSHPDGVLATYKLDNGKYVKSDLNSGFSNIVFYLQKQEAIAHLDRLLEIRIRELQDQRSAL